MKKSLTNVIAAVFLCSAVFILLFQGFGFPPVPRAVDIFLRAASAAAVQLLFFCNFKRAWLWLVPLIAALMAAAWGAWLYFTSPSWVKAAFGSWLADYCSFPLGCLAAWAGRLVYRGFGTRA